MAYNVSGEVSPFLHALLRLEVRGSSGQSITVEARIDTGFDLSLALNEKSIAPLGLQYVKDRYLTLANGDEVRLAEYRARISWGGLERPVRVLAKPGDALVGMALLHGYRLTIEVVDGGAIQIDPLI